MTRAPILCFDHDAFVIVDKPAGVPMHDTDEGIVTLTKHMTGYNTLLPCHRLDTPTSGLLILAKSSQSAAVFGDLFEKKQIQKNYIAITKGKPKKKQGTIAGDMKNRRRGQHQLLKSMDNPAVTQFFSIGLTPGLRAAMVRPLTGKTHQIRVAMKSNGCAILGDEHYGGESADRLYLHAYQLSFVYDDAPITVRQIPDQGDHFTSPDFQRWLGQNGNPDDFCWPNVKGSSNAT